METILVNYEGHVATITINRPKALNALSTQVLTELNEALNEVEANNDVYALIITGAGEKSFVAGADIAEMKEKNVEEAAAYGKFGNEVFRRIEAFRCPVIAAVNGFALGGGCELAMSCDIRLASENAVFGQPEVGLGITPGFGGTQRLSRLVGTGIAKELIYIARNVKAEEAKSIGLVNKVVPAESLLDEAKAMMQTILSKAPLAVRYAKIAINEGIQMDLYRGLELEKDVCALTFGSDDSKEGMSAFLEKRPAVFQNK